MGGVLDEGGGGYAHLLVPHVAEVVGEALLVEGFDVVDLVEQLGHAPAPEDVLIGRDGLDDRVPRVLLGARHVEARDAARVDL